MKAYLSFGVLLAAACTSTAHAQTNEVDPAVTTAVAAYKECLDSTDAQLRKVRVSPERYQMAFEGACLTEFESVTKAFKAHFDAMPHPGVSYEDAQQITSETMASMQSDDQRFKKRFVSAYVLWFASNEASKSSGK